MSYCPNPQCDRPASPQENRPESGPPLRFCPHCGTALLLGDRYRLLRPLGGNAHSRTFLARDERSPGRPRCVLKQYALPDPSPSGAPDPNTEQRQAQARDLFLQEVLKLEQVGRHPQLPELLGRFEMPGNPARGLQPCQYLVFEWIPGDSLAVELAQHGPFAAGDVRAVLERVLPVLHELHSAGVIHRDLKPANLIRTLRPETGRFDLVLVDFGAAKFATATAFGTAGTLVGSVGYTAPEQLMGRAVFSSDLYSLGAIAARLLTQVHPFDLFDNLNNAWAWRDFLPEPVDAELGRVLDGLMSRQLKRRYASAAAAWQDLCPGRPLPRRPQPFVASGFGRSAGGGPPTAAEPRPSGAARLPPTPPTVAVKGWTAVQVFRGHASRPSALVFSPDGRFLASGSWDRTVCLWEPGSREGPLALAPRPGLVDGVAIAADGRTLAAASWDGSVALWGLAANGRPVSQQPDRALRGHEGWVRAIAFHPDRPLLASGGEDRRVCLWSLAPAIAGQGAAAGDRAAEASGVREASPPESCPEGPAAGTAGMAAPERVRELPAPVRALAFSPAGTVLAIALASGAALLWSWADGTVQSLTPEAADSPAAELSAIAFSPDGAVLVAADRAGRLHRWETTAGRATATIAAHPAPIAAIAVRSSDGAIATASEDGTLALWDLAEGRRLAVLRDSPPETLSPSETLRERERAGEGLTAIAISPDGQTIASGNQSNAIHLWRFQ